MQCLDRAYRINVRDDIDRCSIYRIFCFVVCFFFFVLLFNDGVRALANRLE